MCKISNEMSRSDKARAFGVTEATKANTEGLELRYEMEHGQEGEPYYYRQRVFRDKGGKYYLAVRGRKNATAMLSFETWYNLDGREVLIPIRPEALAVWLRYNLYGDEYERAREEFKQAPEAYQYETVYTYQQGDTYEFLQRTTGDRYMLFSTDADYPYPGFNMPYFGCDENGVDNSRDDLYIYYVTPETARRWAEARGMGEAACKEVFGRCA